METCVAELVREGRAAFEKVFHRPATHYAAAPGRVNLIGEHVDYCDGFVLPMAIDKYTVIVGSAREAEKDGHIASIYSLNFPNDDTTPVQFTKDNIATAEELKAQGKSHVLEEMKAFPGWAHYVRGILSLFPVPYPSLDAVIVSNVPMGGGLSSSAALEMSMFAFLEALTGTADIDKKKRAVLCQRAEQDYAGLPCGIMDQFISSLAQPRHAILIDCRSLEGTQAPVDDDVRVLVTNSHVKHQLTGSEYPERQAATVTAAKLLNKPALRDVDMALLQSKKECLSELLFKRARHVVSENERTLGAARALQDKDYATFGALMYQSHASLRDDFQVSCEELDELVKLTEGVEGVYGSRMTGGGFGGCTVTLCTPNAASTLPDIIKAGYSGKDVSFFVCRPAAGAFHGSLDPVP